MFGEYIGRLIGLESHIRNIGEGYAIILTGILVIIGWYISARNITNSHRQQNAHKYLINNNDKLSELVLELSIYLKNRTPFPNYDVDDLDTKDTQTTVKELLTKIELISVDIRHGLVSEKYILDSQNSILINIFDRSKNYISTYRKTREAPTAYRNFECLYLRMKFKKTSLLQRAIECLIHSPLFMFTYYNFSIKYKIYSLFKETKNDYLKETNKKIKSAISILDILTIISYTIIFTLLIVKLFT